MSERYYTKSIEDALFVNFNFCFQVFQTKKQVHKLYAVKNVASYPAFINTFT